jgi:hypothetical protein
MSPEKGKKRKPHVDVVVGIVEMWITKRLYPHFHNPGLSPRREMNNH